MFMKNRLFLFWKIGKSVFEKQDFYENVVSKYSCFYSYYYGMSKTFSRENIRMMRNFYLCFPIFSPVMLYLSWEHYVELICILDYKKRYFYFNVAIFCRSSVLELRNIINGECYERI